MRYVKIGNNVFIGVGSSILQGKKLVIIESFLLEVSLNKMIDNKSLAIILQIWFKKIKKQKY